MSRRPRTCPRTGLSASLSAPHSASAAASPSAPPFPIHGELLAGVLARLDPLLLLRARLVCAEWCHVISSSRHLWQRVVQRQVALADRAGAGPEFLTGGREGENVGSGAQGGGNAHMGVAVGAEQRRRFERGGVQVWVMREHTRGRVSSVAMRHGVIATGGSDDCVRLWQVRAPSSPSSARSPLPAVTPPPSPSPVCRQLACFPSPAAQPITAVDLTDIMLLAASGSQVFAWNKDSGKLLRSFGGHHQRVRTMSYDDTDLLAACADGTVHMYDIYSGSTAQILRPHARAVAAMSYSASMGLLLSGGTDGTVHLSDCHSSLHLHTLLFTDPSPVTSVLLSAPSNRVMAASASGILRVWDLRSPSHTLMTASISPPTHTTLALPSSTLALPPVLLTAGSTGLVQVLDTASLCPLRRLRRPPLAELALGSGSAVALEVEGRGDAGGRPGLGQPGSGTRQDGEAKGQAGQRQVGRGEGGISRAAPVPSGTANGVRGRSVSEVSGVTGIAARTSTFVTSHMDGTATLWLVGF
ncbi:hypothetical protein CLOP_g15604 [Closterium sp. NIES-67]|nr:hypothetical protein CLOP_g15604 [Closterium sp. NIES-67]